MKSKRYVREELAVALRISPETAGLRMDLAHRLVHQLPDTLAAVAAGDLPLFFARALASETAALPADAVAAVEQKVLDRASDPDVGQGYGDFKRCVRRAVLAADPRRAEEKFTAAYEDRRVCDTPDGNAMGWFGAYLPDHQRQALWNRLTDAARRSRRHRTPGDDRSMDQRRADALGHWGITGTLNTFDTPGPRRPKPAPTRRHHRGDRDRDRDGRGGRSAGAAARLAAPAAARARTTLGAPPPPPAASRPASSSPCPPSPASTTNPPNSTESDPSPPPSPA